jgi:hypothetical protein
MATDQAKVSAEPLMAIAGDGFAMTVRSAVGYRAANKAVVATQQHFVERIFPGDF